MDKPSTFLLFDYSVLRRVKPWQNLALIIFAVCWLIIFILLFVNDKNNSLIVIPFMTSMVSIGLFLTLSLLTLYKKHVGEVRFVDGQAYIDGISHQFQIPVASVFLQLNIPKALLSQPLNQSELLRQLPKWGNYLSFSSTSQSFRFEVQPSEALLNSVSSVNITGFESNPILLCRTSDLVRNVFQMLWAAS